MQTPARQLSARVQAFPSSQLVPSGAAGLEQAPVQGSHVPATWHASSGAQTTPAQRSLQTPPMQVPEQHGAAGWHA